MFVRVTVTPKSPRKSVKVVESVRVGLKVKQVMLHNIGVASNDEEIEKLKLLGLEFIAQEQIRRQSLAGTLFKETIEERLENIKKSLAIKEAKKGRKPKTTLKDVTSNDMISLADLVEEDRVIEGIHDVFGYVYDKMGYDQLLTKNKDNEILKDVVLMRLASPSSKRATQNMLNKKYCKQYTLDSIYRIMDKVTPEINEIKKITFNRTKALMPETVDILFYDCTTLYFESTETDTLRKFGYSKDHRFNTTQLVLALATNKDGLPIGYELFEGNKAEVNTLISSINSWKEVFDINKVCFVADRAMMSEANLKMLDDFGYSYVIAAKLKGMPDGLKKQILSRDNYTQESNDFSIGEFEYKNKRLIVSYKEKRAKHDAYQREVIIEKIKKSLGSEGSTGSLITNAGVKKFTVSDKSKTELSEEKIAKDTLWDGLHGIITNIPLKGDFEQASAIELISRYSQLWKIEESFRINKNNLSMRPIYHFKEDRIKSHIAICYMAFSVLRHMEYTVKLTQKISLQEMIDELNNVQSSIYRHKPSGRVYRMPGKFTNKASRIYKSFNISRRNNAQEIIKIM